MGKSFHLQLRAGELFYVNGAALRVDRRVSIEVMNDITFLLGSHILPASQATTVLKRLYFALQLPLLEPARGAEARGLIGQMFTAAEAVYPTGDVAKGLARVRVLYSRGRNFEALKALRALFDVDERAAERVLESVS